MRNSYGFAAAAVLIVAAAGARADDLTIGVEQALTGPYASVGVPIMNATRLAADDINASGVLGDNKIVLEVEDTASDRNQAITLISKFASDPKVLMVVGPTSTIEALAAAPVAADKKIAMITTGISAQVLKSGPYIFKASLEPGQFMDVIAEFAVSKLGVKRCIILFNQQNEASKSQKDAFHDYVLKHGVEVVSVEGYTGTDSDFSALSTKVVGLKPDCVQLDGQAPNTGLIVRQLREAGIPDDVKIIGTVNETVQQFLDVAGSAANGVYSAADFAPGGRDDAGKKFVADYRTRFNSAADNYAAVGYNQLWIVAFALKKTGANPSRDQMRQAMADTGTIPSILGSTGSFSIDADRRVHYDVAMVRVTDGKFVPE